VPIPDDIVIGKDGKLNPFSVKALQESLSILISNYNGRVNLGDGSSGSRAGNLDAVYVNVVTGTANAEFPVKHGLERAPIGFAVASIDKAGIVYSSRQQSWTDTTMFLKCSTATTTIRLRVY
jgi:hypothetical protein